MAEVGPGLVGVCALHMSLRDAGHTARWGPVKYTQLTFKLTLN